MNVIVLGKTTVLYFLQLLLTQFSETTGFGMTFSDTQILADLESELDDVFAIQFYSSNTQLPKSSLDTPEPDQILILAINALPYGSTNGLSW